MDIKERKFRVIVKANSRENGIEGFHGQKNAYVIRIAAKPEDNKANIEVVKFLSKLLKKKVRIISGFKSREKIVEVQQPINI